MAELHSLLQWCINACLAATCHLHFCQNDRGLLRVTAVTWPGWYGHQIRVSWKKSSLMQKKILLAASAGDRTHDPFDHEFGALPTELSRPRRPDRLHCLRDYCDWATDHLLGLCCLGLSPHEAVIVLNVVVHGIVSAPSPLSIGVPQGSVLGPVLFTLYSKPLTDVISAHRYS